jgi:multiple antibiotic resistance protein
MSSGTASPIEYSAHGSSACAITAGMKQFVNYFILGFSALLPLINPPGSALELLGVVGVGQDKPYKFLAKKIAINTTLFLAVVALTGPYVLQFFGISVAVLQAVGGAVLAAMGWSLLNKPAGEKQMSDPNLHTAAQDCLANFWQSKLFYPFTFPITVGPGSVAVVLTLSAQAKSLQFPDRIGAFLGLFVCVVLLSLMVFVFYAYAPSVAQKVPSALAHGVLRIIAFLLICIGVQIAWHGLRSLVMPAIP